MMNYIKLSELTVSLESGSRPKGGVSSDGIPSIGGEHIKSDGTFKFDNMKYVPEDFFNNLKKGVIDRGDILIVKDGATTGKVAFVDNTFPYKNAAINEHVFKLKINNEMVLPKYVFYYLYSRDGNRQLMKDFRGATVGGITKNFLNLVQIPIPRKLEFQNKIVTLLDKARELINKRKAQIEALDQLTQSVFLEMFGDWDKNEKAWEVVSLESITNHITDGVHSKPEYTNDGIPFISVKDINTGKLKFENCKFISEETHQEYIRRCKPELGDILYTKVGATYGIPAIVDTDKEFSLYVSVALIKPKRHLVNSVYLREALRSIWVKRQADRSIKGIGVPDLHLKEIKKFKIILPPLDVQEEFAKLVQKVEKQRELLEKGLIELENNFNSLIQRVFKGELFNY